MGMNFWEAQQKAKSQTTFYVAVFIFLTLFVSAGAELVLRSAAPESYHSDFPFFAVFFLGMTFLVAFYNYSMYKQYGGGYVAESVGARQVIFSPANLETQKLLNIVQEMALAASVPLPKVYIIPSSEINAFAAGLTPDKAAIAITEGALKKLNRDEIQGVIAHEFGHIHNGDMPLSLRLAAMVTGFFFILSLGLRILQIVNFRSGKNKDGKNGVNPALVTAALLMLAGALSWFFGSILKASVSRQREYLADASAVQFTRNPEGLANALRKIEKDQARDMPKTGAPYTHMYLEDHAGWTSLFATHPPIAKRIKAIEASSTVF